MQYANAHRADYDVVDHAREYICPEKRHEARAGVARLHKFEHILKEGFPKGRDGLQPNAFHQMMDNGFVQVFAQNIVGADWIESREELCQHYGWSRTYCTMAACAPRQFGNSTEMCKAAVAFAETMPGTVQSIFSTGRRASNHDLQLLFKMVCMRGLRDQVEVFNQESLWIRFGARGDPNARISKIYAFPSNPKISILLFFHFSPAPTFVVHKETAIRYVDLSWRVKHCLVNRRLVHLAPFGC